MMWRMRLHDDDGDIDPGITGTKEEVEQQATDWNKRYGHKPGDDHSAYADQDPEP